MIRLGGSSTVDGRRWRVLLAVDVAIKVATVLLLLVALSLPELPQFQGKAFAGRAIAYPIALAIVPVVWLLLRRPIPYPVVPDILIGLPFLIDMVGNALGLYDSIEWWDDANHLVNWWLHTAAIAILLAGTGLPRAARAGLGVAWAATTAILWELAEYVAFVPGSPEASTAYADTLGDLALGLLGGTIASVLIAWRLPAAVDAAHHALVVDAVEA
jgi:hypothetical protein